MFEYKLKKATLWHFSRNFKLFKKFESLNTNRNYTFVRRQSVVDGSSLYDLSPPFCLQHPTASQNTSKPSIVIKMHHHRRCRHKVSETLRSNSDIAFHKRCKLKLSYGLKHSYLGANINYNKGTQKRNLGAS